VGIAQGYASKSIQSRNVHALPESAVVTVRFEQSSVQPVGCDNQPSCQLPLLVVVGVTMVWNAAPRPAMPEIPRHTNRYVRDSNVSSVIPHAETPESSEGTVWKKSCFVASAGNAAQRHQLSVPPVFVGAS